jgi:catechol 2,3-dioxygenase-like lactoylglutathione lyase family enzyme
LTDLDWAIRVTAFNAAPVAAFVFLAAALTHIEFDRGLVLGGSRRPVVIGELAVLASSRLQTIIWTSRVADAEQFYSGVLGLPFKGKSHGALLYDVGGSDLRVSPVSSTKPSAHTVLGFAVSDLNAVIGALSARGVEWERFPGFPHDAAGVVVTPEGAKVVWFRDPDGNLLSIVQYD